MGRHTSAASRPMFVRALARATQVSSICGRVGPRLPVIHGRGAVYFPLGGVLST